MKIGVIGLNYVGNSILKALENKNIELIGINSKNEIPEPLNTRTYKVSDKLEALIGCDFIFICRALKETLDTLNSLKEIISSDCIVTDTNEIKEIFNKNDYPFTFIGSNPLIEKTNNAQSANISLFIDKKWIITPKDDENKEKIRKLEQIIGLLGAIPVILDASFNDKTMAYTSELPIILSQAFVSSLGENKEIFKYTTPAFKDISKYVSIDIDNLKDTLNHNSANIKEVIDNFFFALDNLKNFDDNYSALSTKIKESYEKTTGEILRKEKFENIYKKNYWGEAESVSGTASTLANTKHLREVLPKLIEFKNVKTMVDVPCGDTNWISTMELNNISYFGYDIVEDLINTNKEKFKDKPNYNFEIKDVLTAELPEVDLIMCRDLIIHFPLSAIYDLLQNFIKSKSKYLLITHFTTSDSRFINADINFGEFAFRNLTAPPFNLPQPEFLIPEDNFDPRCERYMALYEMDTIDKHLNQ